MKEMTLVFISLPFTDGRKVFFFLELAMQPRLALNSILLTAPPKGWEYYRHMLTNTGAMHFS